MQAPKTFWFTDKSGSRIRLSEVSHLKACYRISSKIAGQIKNKMVRMFPSVTSCASSETNSSLSTNMAAVVHLWFSCYRIFSENTGSIRIMSSSMSSCASTHTKNLVHRQIWPFGSRVRLREISHLHACYRITLKIARHMFLKFGQNVPLNLVVQVLNGPMSWRTYKLADAMRGIG